jgi:hypothetical protein
MSLKAIWHASDSVGGALPTLHKSRLASVTSSGFDEWSNQRQAGFWRKCARGAAGLPHHPHLRRIARHRQMHLRIRQLLGSVLGFIGVSTGGSPLTRLRCDMLEMLRCRKHLRKGFRPRLDISITPRAHLWVAVRQMSARHDRSL